ncbi:MAG TPA: hypothetical protein PKX10_08110 [Propioniciclava tarda]|nr:hypothetical protein [Propioniciclava tarda]
MSDAETPLPRRGLPPSQGGSAADPARRWADVVGPAVEGSPDQVPPPLPVLPSTSRGASAGRRFSADDLPDDWEPAAPRRSASSPTRFGMSPGETQTVPRVGAGRYVASPSETQMVTRIGHATRVAGPSPREPWLRRWLWPIVAVAVVTALVLAGFLLTRPPSAGQAVPSPTPTLSPFSEPAELDGVRAATTWAATTDASPDETRGIRCVRPSTELSIPPVAGSVHRRSLSATSGEPATIVQQLETYQTAEAATRAFSERSIQLGSCAATPDHLAKGFVVTGLADQSVAAEAVVQDASGAVHRIMITRTGTTLLLVDATAQTPLLMDALARAVAPALTRLCGSTHGTCPTNPTVTLSSVPPPGDFPGSLATGDLFRVTPGAGSWVGAQVKPLKLVGSECEGVDLTAPAGVAAAQQHAYVLTDDPKASAHFGLDEVVYTFATDADAKAFSDTVVANVTNCARTKQTASVTALAKVAGAASGQLFTVDQRKTVDTVARSRVVVAAQGVHAIYIAANPTAGFDLPDASWLAIAERALARTAQLP